MLKIQDFVALGKDINPVVSGSGSHYREPVLGTDGRS
jgi:hypothetical protein